MNKYNKLAFNTVIFAIGSFSSKILVFLFTRLYTQYLSPDEFGVADMIVQSANLLIPIATMSIAEGVVRYGLDKKIRNEDVYTSAVIIILVGMTGLTLMLPLIGNVKLLGGYTFLLYAYVYVSGFKNVTEQFVRARGLVKLYAFNGIFTTSTLIISNIILLVGFKMGILGYVLSIIISDGLSIIFLYIVASIHKFLRFNKINKRVLFGMLKFSIPLIPTAILWWFTSVSDRYFIAYMIGAASTGIYAAAYRIPNMLAVLSTIFTQAWSMSAILENDNEGKGRFYTNVLNSYQSMMFIVTAGILLVVKPVMALLVEQRYFEGYIYCPLLILAVLFACFNTSLSVVYVATKRTVNSFVTSLIGAVINIILNFILIPTMGIQGAAAATVISYGVVFFIRAFDTRRYINFKINFAGLLLNLLVCSVMVAIILTQPSLTYLYLSISFVVICAINYKAIISTMKKMLHRR